MGKIDKQGVIRGQSLYIFIKTIIILLLMALIIYRFIGFYYDINDDITLQQLASGYYTGMPDGHLCQFIKYFYGNVIAKLFIILPQIDWYGTVLIGLNFLCYALIISRIYCITANLKDRIFVCTMCGLIMLILFFKTTVLFQFTIVSGTLSATALFLLITLPLTDNLFNYCIIWILYLISAMLRGKMFFMVLPLFILISVYHFYKNGYMDIEREKTTLRIHVKSRKNIFVYLMIVFIGISLNIAVNRLEDFSYSEERWERYSEYNHYRSIIMDYYGWPAYEGNEDFWNSIDITQEEHECLFMFGILPDIDEEKIRSIAEYSQSIISKETMLYKFNKMYNLFLSAAFNDQCRTQNLLLVVMLIILFFYWRKTDNIHRCFIVLGIFVQGAILLYLLYAGRLPDRIIIAYDFQCILTMLGFIENLQTADCRNKRSVYSYLGIGISLVLLSMISLYDAKNSIETYKNYLGTYSEVKEYITDNPEKVYISTVGTISSKKQYTFFDDKQKVNWFGSYGWSSKSPWYETRFSELGIDSRSHVLLEKAVYLMTNNIAFADSLEDFYQSKGLLKNSYEIIDLITLSNGMSITVVKY